MVETLEAFHAKAHNKMLVSNYLRQISFDLFPCFSLEEESYPFNVRIIFVAISVIWKCSTFSIIPSTSLEQKSRCNLRVIWVGG